MTSLRSSVGVMLNDDGVSRHVLHLRCVPNARNENEERPPLAAEDDDGADDEAPAEREERYPARDRKVPQRYGMNRQDIPVYV